jgi:hypothetical protein
MTGRIHLDVQLLRAQIALLRHTAPEVEEEAQLLEDMLEGETDFREVCTRLLRMEREAHAIANAIAAQVIALTTRQTRYSHQQKVYRNMIQSLMDAGGQTKVVLPEATISVSKGRDGCIVTDEAALPDEFVRIERIPKKTEILAALAAGERVPGAEKTNGNSHLTIRT